MISVDALAERARVLPGQRHQPGESTVKFEMNDQSPSRVNRARSPPSCDRYPA